MCYCGPGGMNQHQMGLCLPGNGISSAVILPHRTVVACSAASCRERKSHVASRPALGDMTAGTQEETATPSDKYHSEETDIPQGQASGQSTNPQVTKDARCHDRASAPREMRTSSSQPGDLSELPVQHKSGSAPPEGNTTTSSLHESIEKTKESSRWLGFVAGFRGSGCSVVLDKSADLIELTDESTTEENELCRSASCSCTTKPQRRWLFSRHKCKSLDSTGESIHVFRVSSHHSMEQKAEKLNSSECSLSTVYSVSAGPSCPDVHRQNICHCDSESNEQRDGDFRGRSFSLTPTVNLAVFETESSSECEEDIPEDDSRDMTGHCQAVNAPLLINNNSSAALPCSPSAAQLSLASSATDGGLPICKICHTSSKDGDPLISPCRCSGTMQFIHCGCLMRWLEISSKKSRKPPSCELCQYQYHWHKKFKVRHWQFPHCSRKDKILHLMFFISVAIMIACATITIMCFKQDKGTKVDPDRTELTESEIVTLVCGVLFFLAFFVAMYVEVKARNTIYKLLVRFVYLNQQWYIDEYEKKDSAPVSV